MYLKKQSGDYRNKTTKEVSAGAIAFAIRGKVIKVLLLLANRPDEYYVEIGPKGHIEGEESELQAANREIREEIGMPLHIDSQFREEEKYAFMRKDPKTGEMERVEKKVVYFVAFMNHRDMRQITLSDEHKKYFIVPIDQAIKEAEYVSQERILEAAKEYITRRYIVP
jgi:tRNA nucleotidyltransferase (CCA-adding enzyme)